MVCATYAVVVDRDMGSAHIRDLQSGTVFSARMKGDSAFDMQAGDEGLFLGFLLPTGVFEIKRVDKRKMLNPMFEVDLFNASGRFTLIETVDNPFTDAFIKYLDEIYKDSNAQRLIAEREAQIGDSGTPLSLSAQS